MPWLYESGVELVLIENPPIGRGETNDAALLDALQRAVARGAGSITLHHLLVGELVHEDYTQEAGVEVNIQTLNGGVLYDELPAWPEGSTDQTLVPPMRVADQDTPCFGVIKFDIDSDPEVGMVATAQPYMLVRNIEATPEITQILHRSV